MSAENIVESKPMKFSDLPTEMFDIDLNELQPCVLKFIKLPVFTNNTLLAIHRDKTDKTTIVEINNS